MDTITCKDKAEAHKVIDQIGGTHITDWEFLDNGKVRLILDCDIKDL